MIPETGEALKTDFTLSVKHLDATPKLVKCSFGYVSGIQYQMYTDTDFNSNDHSYTTKISTAKGDL